MASENTNPNSSEDKVDNMFTDCKKFTEIMKLRTGKEFSGKIDREFITKMVIDELMELKDAKDVTEEVDALLDAVYYILQHLSTTGLDIRPIWKLIHKANMTKFGPTGYQNEDGKWMKPKDFVPPDEDIRTEIKRQQDSMEKEISG
eukprot:301674_1